MMRLGAVLGVVLLCSAASAAPVAIEGAADTARVADASRIVALGGGITEMVFALGCGDQLVGVDASSKYPPEVEELPKVAYHRRLSAEGVLSLSPTVVLASPEAGPPAAIEQLRAAGVDVVVAPREHTAEGTAQTIRVLAQALDRHAQGAQLVEVMERDLAKAARRRDAIAERRKVLFIYARGQRTLMVAGRDVGAHTMIQLAGGVNAVDGYEGYKPLTAESAVAAAPDLVLLMDSGLQSVGGASGVRDLPGLAETPAGRAGQVASMDGLLLLGFGPRLGQAVLELQDILYGENKGE